MTLGHCFFAMFEINIFCVLLQADGIWIAQLVFFNEQHLF